MPHGSAAFSFRQDASPAAPSRSHSISHAVNRKDPRRTIVNLDPGPAESGSDLLAEAAALATGAPRQVTALPTHL